MRAVRFDEYGSVDVLQVVDVETPTAGDGQVVVQVAATSINPGEIMIREGEASDMGFPSGQGSDFAGQVAEVGGGVSGWTVGDEVLGWTEERAAQAERVAVPADQITRRPEGVSVEQAGSLYVAGATAYAMVDAVDPQAGETIAVAGAAGGVGSIAVQLLRHREVRVLGIAGEGNADFLSAMGIEPVPYGDGLADALEGIDGMLDCFGGGYVAQARDLGVAAERIVTIIDFDAGEQGEARVVFGHEIASAEVMAELAELIAAGHLTIPIAATYPLEDVRAAYIRLAERHTRGKIVLAP